MSVCLSVCLSGRPRKGTKPTELSAIMCLHLPRSSVLGPSVGDRKEREKKARVRVSGARVSREKDGKDPAVRRSFRKPMFPPSRQMQCLQQSPPRDTTTAGSDLSSS